MMCLKLLKVRFQAVIYVLIAGRREFCKDEAKKSPITKDKDHFIFFVWNIYVNKINLLLLVIGSISKLFLWTV